MSLVASGFKEPEEQRTLLLDGLEASVVTFVQEDGVSVLMMGEIDSEVASVVDLARDEGKESEDKEDLADRRHNILNFCKRLLNLQN